MSRTLLSPAPTVTQAPVTNTPESFDGWALLNGQFTYLDGDLARRAFEITRRVEAEDKARDQLPHVDTVPHDAQSRIDWHTGYRGWRLYLEREQVKIPLPARAAREIDQLIREHCTVRPTRSGKKQNASLPVEVMANV